jgi:hypothetical protein
VVVEDAEYHFPQLSGVLLDRFFEQPGYSPGGVVIRAASESGEDEGLAAAHLGCLEDEHDLRSHFVLVSSPGVLPRAVQGRMGRGGVGDHVDLEGVFDGVPT